MGRLLFSICALSLTILSLSHGEAALSSPVISPAVASQQDQTAAKQDFKIAVNVEMVPVNVTVLGMPVRDLRLEDFVVGDNDVPQPLIYFSREQMPLSVALVVDSSGSLSNYLPDLQGAARSALETLKPDDQVVLFGFSTFPSRLTEFTRNHALINAKLSGLRRVGSTNIWDALFVAAHYLRQSAPDRRRAIILISDNGQVINWGQTPENALQEAFEADAAIYAIETKGTGSLYAESEAVRKVAEETGGEFIEATTPDLLSRAMERSFSRIRLQYTLGFAPHRAEKDGAFHRLTVTLNSDGLCPDCRLLARRGYYAGTPAATGTVRAGRRSLPPGTRVDAEVYNRITIAAADTEDLTEIPFQVRTVPAEGFLGRLRTNVIVQIDPAGIRFAEVYGRQTARLCIVLFMAMDDGVYYGTEWRNLDIQPKGEVDQEMMKSGIPFLTQIRGSPTLMKVVVYDLQSNRMGSQLVRKHNPAGR
jgi:Ca-activated chloride channel family protein